MHDGAPAPALCAHVEHRGSLRVLNAAPGVINPQLGAHCQGHDLALRVHRNAGAGRIHGGRPLLLLAVLLGLLPLGLRLLALAFSLAACHVEMGCNWSECNARWGAGSECFAAAPDGLWRSFKVDLQALTCRH